MEKDNTRRPTCVDLVAPAFKGMKAKNFKEEEK
jgi:hypothetical protein